MGRFSFWILVVFSMFAAQAGYVPHATREYGYITVRGHGVYISPEAWARQALLKRVLAKLERDLEEVDGRLPTPAVAMLAHVPIWIEDGNPAVPGGAYHGDRDWLKNHGENPDKARSVEIGNVTNYLEWARTQPFMILHEFSHAYHHQVAGYQNTTILWAFGLAVKSGQYNNISYAGGGRKRAYGLENEREYFAEMSEAYFALNDFYPYNRDQLAQFDPAAVAMIERVWLGR